MLCTHPCRFNTSYFPRSCYSASVRRFFRRPLMTLKSVSSGAFPGGLRLTATLRSAVFSFPVTCANQWLLGTFTKIKKKCSVLYYYFVRIRIIQLLPVTKRLNQDDLDVNVNEQFYRMINKRNFEKMSMSAGNHRL